MSILNTFGYILRHPLNKGRPVRSLARFLRWQIGSRLAPGQVVYHWIDGSRVIVRPGETGFTTNIYCGLYELADMAYLLHVLDSHDLFVDVGANVGSYTILASAVRGARTYCFEPVRGTYDRLLDNITLNRLDERVLSFNSAVGSVTDEVAFTTAEGPMNHIVVPTESVSDVVSVKVVTLDSVLSGEAPALIKIDVEGFETAVLEGALNVLNKDSLHSLIIELNGSGVRYGYDEDEIPKLLSGYGFAPYAYDPFTRQLTPLPGKNDRSGNTLFVRDLETARRKTAQAPTFSVFDVQL